MGTLVLSVMQKLEHRDIFRNLLKIPSFLIPIKTEKHNKTVWLEILIPKPYATIEGS